MLPAHQLREQRRDCEGEQQLHDEGEGHRSEGELARTPPNLEPNDARHSPQPWQARRTDRELARRNSKKKNQHCVF